MPPLPPPFSHLRRLLRLPRPDHHLLLRLRHTPFFSTTPLQELTATTPPSPPPPEAILYSLHALSKDPPRALAFFHRHAAARTDLGTAAYSFMLRTLGTAASAAEFWRFLEGMEAAGHSMDEGTYLAVVANFKKEKLAAECARLTARYDEIRKNATEHAVVSAAADAVRGIEELDSAEVDKMVAGVELPVTEVAVANVLRKVRDCPFKALAFFRWAGRQPGYKNGTVAYNAMARVLGQEESMREFWVLIQEMKAEGFDMDIDTYVKLSRQFQKRHMMTEAVELYEFVMDGPYKPSVHNGPGLLRQIALAPVPDLELVYRVVRKFEAVWQNMPKDMFDGIHRALTRSGRFDEAAKIMEEMRDRGHTPDNITYSQLVSGLCNAGRLDEARKVLDEMEAAGCIPDLKTWTMLIQGHCMAGAVEKALKYLTEMNEKNLQADADLLDIVLKGLCASNKVDAAYSLFIEMVQRGELSPWQRTYKHLIDELLKVKKLEEALGLLRSMKDHKFPPFRAPFPSFIAKHGTVEDAREFLKALRVNNNYPSHTAYLDVFKSFLEEGKSSEAQDLLYKCPIHIRRRHEVIELFESINVQSAS